MNRILVIILTLIAIFTVSCEKYNQDPIPDNDSSSYIFFAPKVKESVESRAIVTGTTLPTGAEFGVSGKCNGTQIFTGYENNIAQVYRNNGTFVYNNLAQWKDATSEHTFYAFYPYSSNFTSVTLNGDGVPQIQYTQPETQADMVDILTISTTTTKDYVYNPQNKLNGEVSLNFIHRLWALDVEIKNSNYLSEIMSVNEVYIYIDKVYKKGNLYSSSNVTDILTKEEDRYMICFPLSHNQVGYPIQLDKQNQSLDFSSNPLLFLPVEGIRYSIELLLNIKPDDRTVGYDYEYKTPFQSVNTRFEAGKRYKLTIERKTSGDFDVTWSNPTNWNEVRVPHTFY